MTNPPTTEGQPGDYETTPEEKKLARAVYLNELERRGIKPTPPTASALAEELAERICDIDGLCIAACPGDPDLTAKAVQPKSITAILTPALVKLVTDHEADKKRFADSCRQELVELRAESADLREKLERAEADTRRLDWLESGAFEDRVTMTFNTWKAGGRKFRSAIDAQEKPKQDQL